MSFNSTRRIVALAAPLALAGLALTACNPTHVTSMDSPTPSGSNLATPYVPGSDSHAEESASASASATDTASSSAEAATTGFPNTDSVTSFVVQSVSVDGAEVSTGSLSALASSSYEGKFTITAMGQCDQATFTVKATSTGFTGKKASTNEAACSTATSEAKATVKIVDAALSGDFTVTDDGETSTITAGTTEIVVKNA